MATPDPNLEPYEKGKPNPVDLMTDLSPLACLAYTHHAILACGEMWSAFIAAATADGDEAPEWMADVPRAISVLADGWLEMQMATGANWLTITGEIGGETTSSDSSRA